MAAFYTEIALIGLVPMCDTLVIPALFQRAKIDYFVTHYFSKLLDFITENTHCYKFVEAGFPSFAWIIMVSCVWGEMSQVFGSLTKTDYPELRPYPPTQPNPFVSSPTGNSEHCFHHLVFEGSLPRLFTSS
jgi:hypothetical protein